VQATRLAASFDRVNSAYWTGEISMQNHVRFRVFFQKSPKQPDAKVSQGKIARLLSVVVSTSSVQNL